MQSFVTRERNEPEKWEVSERIRTFEEIYDFFNNKQVARQAERCVQCGDPFCSAIGCPLGNYIPRWLEAIAEKDLHKAFLLSNESSPFPEILGRVCPQNKLCEGACTLDDGFGAITIGAIEASITDLGFKQGYELPFPGITTDKKVAVIGSGPASISCAHFLLRAGIAVEMFERAQTPGGLLSYGIPGFKMSKKLVERRFELLKKAGLSLHLGTHVGKHLSMDKLIEGFDAVFVGVGATRGKSARLEHEDHPQVYKAMHFLTAVQRRLYGEGWDPRFEVKGKKVVVIGGGDTAMDCLRTAIREDALEITCLYRRDQANMPGSAREYYNAVEEGVEFLFHESPKEFVLNDKGNLVGIDAMKTRLGDKGSDGRRRMEEIEDSLHCVQADVVILALGFDTEENRYLKEAEVDTDDWGQIKVDACGRSSHPAIWAGGDCKRGADLVVTAAADGREAAFSMMETLLKDS